jgi:conjugal transfer pilus assembly protein TraW
MVIKPLAMAVCMALATSSFASDLGIKPFDIKTIDPSVLEQVKSVSEQASKTMKSVDKTDMAWLEELRASTPQIEPEEAPDLDEAQVEAEKKHPLGDGIRTLIFVSWSMGATAIKDIMAAYDGRPGTGIVFRGIPDGMKMVDAVQKMHMLTQDTQSQVSVLLDPLAFQRHAVDAVPAIVLEAEDDSLMVKASGTSSVRLVDDAAAEGAKPGTDLGVHGVLSDIIEPDLLEVAKARIEALDMEAMKKRAIDRFWTVHTGTPLPPVTVSAKRLVDPSVIIPQDILDHQGNVVQKAGRINPLEMMPFNQKLVVIDPTEDWQVELAKREYADHGVNLTVTVMATQIPATSGWEVFEATQDAIDAPLYLLPADMAQRFQILRAPSVVTAEGLSFAVREFTKAEVEGDTDETL